MLKSCLLIGLYYISAVVAQEKSCDKNSSFDDIEELDVYMHEGIDSTLPAYKQDFCKGHPVNVSRRISKSALDWATDSTLAFENPPGPVNGGMCWLHSRLQRSFTYLANYRADLPKPSKAEAMKIIDRIVNRKGVTEIPGYKNLNEFSTAYKQELIDAIDGMGWKCTVNPTDCPARLGDSYSPSAQEIQGTMEKLYERRLAQPGDIHFLRTRRLEDKDKFGSSVRAHSLLVLDMEPIRGKRGVLGPIEGYNLKVIDPNMPAFVHTIAYQFGDKELFAGLIKIIPYTHYEYDGDIPEMRADIEKYCKK